MGVFFLNFLRALKGPTKNLVLRTTLFLVYLLFGAAVFQTIESGAEHKEIHHFDKVQQQMREKYNISDAEMNHLFEEISKAIDDGYFDVGYDRWSFAGSLFFSGTVVTTIGYGKMAPMTVWGRIFCIFYAIFGIPITGLMLKSIGERITETTANFWKLVDSKIFKREPRKIYLKTVACIFLMVTGMILLLAGIGKTYEGWTFFEGVYFAFITLSTIGFGDYVPQHPSKSDKDHHGYVIAFTVLTFVYFTFGLAVVSSALLAISRLFEDEPPWGFISLMGRDAEDDEEENLLLEKKKAQEKSKMAESSGP